MHPNADLLTRFYQAFARRDHATMGASYGPEAHFSDPVFPDLRGTQIAAMWRMLCLRATDLRIESTEIQADDTRGTAHWEAWYTYGGTGRPVHNVIEATFNFEAGLIRRHADRFDLYRWSRQALGVKGILLGWAPPVQGTIRATAARALAKSAAPPAG
jgi:ketosteroid isomerase-like protein